MEVNGHLPNGVLHNLDSWSHDNTSISHPPPQRREIPGEVTPPTSQYDGQALTLPKSVKQKSGSEGDFTPPVELDDTAVLAYHIQKTSPGPTFLPLLENYKARNGTYSDARPLMNGLENERQSFETRDYGEAHSLTNGLEKPLAPSTNVKDAKGPLVHDLYSTKNGVAAEHAPAIEAYNPLAPASTRLRHMIKNLDRIIVCPGVYDGLSARIALEVGFDGMYMTGAGTTASRLGAADLGIAQLHDMRTNAEMIANLQPGGPPLIADMDTGYGGPIVIAKAVQQYALSGVAGFHIEDQVMQKRCGHLQGKEVVDVDTYIQRIRACVVSARQLRSDIVIIARTDALQSRGYDECIHRLRRARDAGADMGILEGFTDKQQARRAVLDLAPWPLCLNSVENGISPLITAAEAQALGFRVVIFSFAALAPAYSAIRNTFQRLKTEGVVGTARDVTPKTIFRICGLEDSMLIDEAAGGTSFAKDV
ncbi:hypothetical protein MMC34_005961 [Xylographa carneopallida]|nr:hypothetical protein [Xylographa carneopallida]